ncbi:sensor histidine kinase [Sagittula stellata]|uniref:histidine kinase n=1 Tax=Sagittula stellata (strain ATCC 700073 / DSM 11524 / E-37) TaxID=388399 RepID=A3K6L9_SAGS3|nr:HAMP domain-containing sensor histidine kinase [Sagittula stellata]EBA06996.1 hypothetical protein SSE37_12401 [Sagittula stellata E-37]
MKDLTETDEAERDFESYLYIVTHDLKTYSRAMRVIPEWIEEDLDAAGHAIPVDVREHVTMLRDYARGLDLMLDGLTELSRVGRLADTPDLHPLTEALLDAWRRVPGSEGFELDLTGAEGTVLAPGNDLDRMLFAVLSNCVRHHDAAHGHVSVGTTRHGERIVLTVTDDGPGIEPDYREKVFEPLFTLRAKDEVGTAGMGLAVAKKVVKNIGGAIAIADGPARRGCTVKIDLPLAPEPIV